MPLKQELNDDLIEFFKQLKLNPKVKAAYLKLIPKLNLTNFESKQFHTLLDLLKAEHKGVFDSLQQASLTNKR